MRICLTSTCAIFMNEFVHRCAWNGECWLMHWYHELLQTRSYIMIVRHWREANSQLRGDISDSTCTVYERTLAVSSADGKRVSSLIPRNICPPSPPLRPRGHILTTILTVQFYQFCAVREAKGKALKILVTLRLKIYRISITAGTTLRAHLGELTAFLRVPGWI